MIYLLFIILCRSHKTDFNSNFFSTVLWYYKCNKNNSWNTHST